ncbi:hypothetical protein PS627_01205 [Pseudomonas fluorescens]|uniref:hypothetical protein n=1 Tax=Pseudomonas fluorescens TaxID=294 RepID=UPI0012535A79|nr:hypothetical protein [Pseudomonas fluorescens]CAG8865299.1 hypothetical protein PS627_01205 [Pseudomonas fluorescens]
MGPDFDDGSFKKARSFLLVFSTMLLILWYFKAEMSTLSVLGNSIKFTANAEDLWLVLSVADGYFFCRYIQHLPKDWLKPGERFEDLFESTFCKVTTVLYMGKLKAEAWADFKDDHDVAGVTKFRIQPSGSRYRSRDTSSGDFMFPTPEMKVDFSLPSTWISSSGGECSSTGFGTIITPHKAVVIYSRAISFTKGLFLTPWFTEHLFPMLYAVCAISVGLWSWDAA